MTNSFARCALSVVLAAGVVATASAQSAAPPSAASSDEVTYVVAPYLIGAGMSGTVGVRQFDTTVDMSASDVLSHLKAGFMGFFAAKKNGWGFALDTIYSKLGTEPVTKGPVTVEPAVSTGLYAFLVTRQITPAAELVFGARVTSATTTLGFTSPTTRTVSDSKTWVDPVAGVNLALPFSAKAKFTMLADVGGFGTASTISVDLVPALQFRVAKHAWLALGYRYIYDDYKDDTGFVYKVTIQGPGFGVVFPF
jgi:hypothetical protein